MANSAGNSNSRKNIDSSIGKDHKTKFFERLGGVTSDVVSNSSEIGR